MVDLNTCPPTPPAGENFKIKNLMGKTPAIGILKTKFLTVLGNSNDLLNGISNKLTLSISSSESEYCDEDEEVPQFDETIDYTKIDFDSRRLKARRAHEEILSGRYRYPNLSPRQRNVAKTKIHKQNSRQHSCSSISSSLSSLSIAAKLTNRSSTTPSNSIESRNSGGYGRPGRPIPGARRSDLDIEKDMRCMEDTSSTPAPHIDVHECSANTLEWSAMKTAGVTSGNSICPQLQNKPSNSSTMTSLRDEPEAVVSPSVESTDWNNFIRSESQNSVSGLSSISLDCRTGEEPEKEFMKKFSDILFANATAISMELKSEFGARTRIETGRQWFTRFLLKKSKTKCLSEQTFQALKQFLAIVLFECAECEDYGPAATVMSICFIFYHEIEVPGCEPYREYLFQGMRQQPIWQNLRFWNSAFFDAVQTARELQMTKSARSLANNEQQKKSKTAKKPTSTVLAAEQKETCLTEDEGEQSASSSPEVQIEKSITKEQFERESVEVTQMHENIVFRQLCTFSCNMHALGVRQDLCLEFHKRQSVTWNISKEQVNIIKENIQRMYHETELWGSKEA